MAPRSLAGVAPASIVAGALIAASVLITLWAQALNPLTSDVAWLITVAERMLEGQRLYLDIAETNPPMSVWIYLPWTALANWLQVDPGAVVAIATIAFAFLCMVFCDRILAPLFAPQWRPVAWVLGTVVLCVVPGTAFAQREHVAILALLPALCALYAAATGRRETWAQAIGCGLLAGLALALKPHLGLGLLLPALALAWSSRSLAPVLARRHLIAAAVVVAYSGGVILLYPAFGEVMLPLVNETYLPMRLHIARQVINPHVMLYMAFTAGFAWLNRDRLGRLEVLVPLLASVGFFVAYFLPGKGFAYHLLPASSVMVLAFALTLLTHRHLVRGHHAMLATSFIALSLLALPIPAWLAMDRWQDGLVDAVDDYGPITSIALISDDLGQASPLHRTLGAELVNNGPSLWAARGALTQAARTTDPERQRYLLGLSDADRIALRERIATENPEILLVSDGAVDWQAWADEDVEFKALFAGYHPVASVPFKQDMVNVLVRNNITAR